MVMEPVEPRPEEMVQGEEEFIQEELAREEEAKAQEVELLTALNMLKAWHAQVNIASELDEETINSLASRVIEDFNSDKDSRKAWEELNREILDTARLVLQKKTYAGEQVANVKYPLITNSAIQFAARAYPEIVKGADVVKPKIIGDDPEGLKAERGERVCDHMSYQLLHEMRDWEDGVDQMLFTMPVVGCAFKKTYYSGVESRNISEMVFPEDLVVQYNAVSLEKAARVSHIIYLSHNEVVERIRSKVYLDFDVDDLGHPSGVEEEDKPVTADDEDAPHKFIEQHRWYDLDKDGYKEPYVVTVHYETQKLVRVAARYDLDGVFYNEGEEIVRIEPVHYFTRFLFMPAIDGSFYGMGFGTLLHSVNSTINSTINQLLDAGTINNRQSGFLGKGIRLGRGSSLKFKPGEWKPVETTGDDLRKNLVPLPTHEPSATLFNLLGMLIESGKELSGITEVLSGQSPGSNVPAETTLALIEQGLQAYTAIQKRIHRSLYREFAKIRRLNTLYLDENDYAEVSDNPSAVKALDYKSSDLDIIPVSDPNSTTNMQRIIRAKALLELRGQGLNDMAIVERYLKALQIEDIEELTTVEDQEPDPVEQLTIQDLQAKVEKTMAELEKIRAETQLVLEEIRTEQVTQNVKQSGVEFDRQKLEIERAQTVADIRNSERKTKLDAALAVSNIRRGAAPPKKPTAASPKKPTTSQPGKPGGDDSQFEGKTAKTYTQGPYRERGSIKSNNKNLDQNS